MLIYFIEMACEKVNQKPKFFIKIFHKPGTSYEKQGVLMTVDKRNSTDVDYWQLCQQECSELLCQEEFNDYDQFIRAFENAIERCHLYAPF